MLQVWPSPSGSQVAIRWCQWAARGRPAFTIFDMISGNVQNDVGHSQLRALQWAPSGKRLAALVQRNRHTFLELLILEGNGTGCMSLSYAPAGLVRPVDPYREYFMVSWSPQETFVMIASWNLPPKGSCIEERNSYARGSLAVFDMNTISLVVDGTWTRNVDVGLFDQEAPLQVLAHLPAAHSLFQGHACVLDITRLLAHADKCKAASSTFLNLIFSQCSHMINSILSSTGLRSALALKTLRS